MNKRVAAGILGGISLVGGSVVTVDKIQNPYIEKINTLEISKGSSLPDAGEIKNIVSKDEPKVTFSKWNGEVALGVKSLDVPSNSKGKRALLSDKVEWGKSDLVVGVFGGVNDIVMEAIPVEPSPEIEDGGMEINLILNSKPNTNTFRFQLDNWEDLDFFYQTPLWQEAGLDSPTKECTDTDCNISNEGASHRPENVVGSYAVYYKDHANHKVGSTNYATGKAYHIFRPLVTDNNENEIWAEMSYSNGVLSVIVPQSFLDSASYPVKVDPTFGVTSIGVTDISFAAVNTKSTSQMTLSTTGNITKLTFYEPAIGQNAGNRKGIIYDSSGSSANALKGTTNARGTPTTGVGDWVDLTFSSSIALSPADYFLGVIGDSAASGRGDSTGSTGQATGNNNFNNDTYSDGPSDPFGTPSTSTFEKSIYATYTASGGANTPHVILPQGVLPSGILQN